MRYAALGALAWRWSRRRGAWVTGIWEATKVSTVLAAWGRSRLPMLPAGLTSAFAGDGKELPMRGPTLDFRRIPIGDAAAGAGEGAEFAVPTHVEEVDAPASTVASWEARLGGMLPLNSSCTRRCPSVVCRTTFPPSAFTVDRTVGRGPKRNSGKSRFVVRLHTCRQCSLDTRMNPDNVSSFSPAWSKIVTVASLEGSATDMLRLTT
mmetsp:Transcript_1455/g.3533  ORF Transcript_1455/g.3533 Transcript_1455/m.3533 type:complete len:207 (+) Transcript_1455:1178-1798(+)